MLSVQIIVTFQSIGRIFNIYLINHTVFNWNSGNVTTSGLLIIDLNQINFPHILWYLNFYRKLLYKIYFIGCFIIYMSWLISCKVALKQIKGVGESLVKINSNIKCNKVNKYNNKYKGQFPRKSERCVSL